MGFELTTSQLWVSSHIQWTKEFEFILNSLSIATSWNLVIVVAHLIYKNKRLTWLLIVLNAQEKETKTLVWKLGKTSGTVVIGFALRPDGGGFKHRQNEIESSRSSRWPENGPTTSPIFLTLPKISHSSFWKNCDLF